MRRWALGVAALLPTLASACEWDTDTLAEEAGLAKDYVAAISGRFPRNPPLYYRMRRDRILARGPRKPEEFDDLAVAFDKLGEPLEALKWIDRKPKSIAKDDKDAWYRYHANRGTFLIHAWLGGKRPLEAGKEGLRDLEEAIRINPDAHFGRENSQIKLVKAFLKPSEANFDPYGDNGTEAAARREAEGYAGIVRLGAGWESPDVFRALAADLGALHLGAVASMALLRADELEAAGRKARFPKSDYFPMVEGSQGPQLLDDTRSQFRRLRAEADAWQARRTAYMAARLEKGAHPDTDPHFWNDWKETPPPKVVGPTRWSFAGLKGSPSYVLTLVAALAAFILVPALLFLWVVRLWRRWAKPRSS